MWGCASTKCVRFLFLVGDMASVGCFPALQFFFSRCLTLVRDISMRPFILPAARDCRIVLFDHSSLQVGGCVRASAFEVLERIKNATGVEYLRSMAEFVG